MRSMTKKMRSAAENNDADTLKSLLPKATKLIQKLAQKGIIHKNQANRRVSRLSKLANKAS